MISAGSPHALTLAVTDAVVERAQSDDIYRARLARALGACPATAPKFYSTSPAGALPPGRSRRWLRDHAREIGAERIGGKRGRGVEYRVAVDRYEAWLASRSTIANTDDTSPAADVDEWITAAGYRATRRGKR